MLHNENKKDKSNSEPKQDQTNDKDKNSDNMVCNLSSLVEIMHLGQVLLSTAVVKIKHRDDHFVTAKALP